MRTYKELIVSSAIASLVALSSTAAAIELTEVGSGKIENINIPKDQNTEETVQNTPTTQNSTVDAAGASESAAVQKSVKTEDNSQTAQPVRTSGGKKTAYISDDAKVWATRGPGKQYKLSGQIRIGERVEFLSERNDYAEIRTPTGSVVWVPKREIQFEESNLYKVTRLSQENTELKFKLDNIDSETIRDIKKATTELEALRKEHDALKKAHEEMEEQMKETTELNEELKGRLETKDLDKQLKWWTRGGIIALSGALVGVILVYLPRPRRRNRRYY